MPFETVQLMRDRLRTPLGWKQPRTVFVNSVSDLFHVHVPFDFVDQVFAIMALTPRHTYQILTKRPERMAQYLNERWLSNGGFNRSEVISGRMCDADGMVKTITRLKPRGAWPLPNVWLGTSVEDQATADARIPDLLNCPAVVRFLSCEPLLGPIVIDDAPRPFRGFMQMLRQAGVLLNDPPQNEGINWVIVGGESGEHARPMHPDWAKSLRDQCKDAGVPFFFKQWGEWLPFPQHNNADQRSAISRTTIEHGKTGNGAQSVFGMHIRRNERGEMVKSYTAGITPVQINRVGKKISGNQLDGVVHAEFPQVPSSATP